MLYIGIDSGTQSTKSIVLDLASGQIIASAQKTYELIPGLPPGHLEQDPQVWLEAVDATIQACLQPLGPRKNDLRAVGVSGQQHGLVALNDANGAVRPAKLWCDTSTARQCEEIISAFGGGTALIKLLGNTMLPGWTAPKILWLKQNEPDNYRSVRSVLLPCSGLLQAFLDQIGLKGSLKTSGIPEGELPALAKQSMVLPDYTNNPKVPTPEESYEVLARSF